MSLERADQLRDLGLWAEAERMYADLLDGIRITMMRCLVMR